MPNDLWSFAQTLYARPGVENACLRLQTSGADVCLLLTALWLERHRIAFTTARSAELHLLARDWQHDVVKPLRQLRINWRTAAQNDQQQALLREQLKTLELQAERTLLLRLEQHALRWSEEVAGDWLNSLAGVAALDNRDALENLRIAASTA